MHYDQQPKADWYRGEVPAPRRRLSASHIRDGRSKVPGLIQQEIQNYDKAGWNAFIRSGLTEPLGAECGV
ncbi:hypothetical protein RHIZ404_200173 [Rhizobium sp. EC-SD404]|nr:hypothetical protein RHIZ404_200173 [Rhizobium sp. EC-SD404]